jgi:6-phosphofructokinase
MGRNAGWLTAATALAKEHPEDAPQLIYLPEHGVSREQIVQDVTYWYKNLGHCVVAVSEGLKDEEGHDIAVSAKDEVDAFGHKRKAGVMEYLEALIKEHLHETVRWDKPQYLQRSFGELISSVDREEAYNVGRAAVRAAVSGHSDQMVTIVRLPGPQYAVEIGLADLSEVANVEHKVPAEYINAQGNGVTEAFLNYARPLIGGPLMPYARLAKHIVAKRVQR